MANYIRGVLFCILWFFSIFTGYILLYCPLLPILIINNKAYRNITDSIFRFWELYPTALIQLLFGTKFIVTGDQILHNDMAVVVMNHRTRTDWNFLWPIFYRAVDTRKHSLKFILKDEIKQIPGPGWVMQLTAFLYIKRRWNVDRKTLSTFAEYMTQLQHKCQVLVFPEGTDLTKETLIKSHSFSEKNGLEKYKHVLQPRTAGFSYLVNQLQTNNHLDALYDLTIGYPDKVPQTEKNIVQGHFPKEIHCHIKRYDATDIPNTEDELKEFLQRLWAKKEHTMKRFEQVHRFESTRTLERGSWPALYYAFVAWTALPFIVLYLCIYSNYLLILALCHTAALLLVAFAVDGFLAFEILLFLSKSALTDRK